MDKIEILKKNLIWSLKSLKEIKTFLTTLHYRHKISCKWKMASDASNAALSNTQSSKKANTTTSRPFLEWIHCNSCYEPYIKKERKFYLMAGCNHISCDKCTVLIKQTAVNGPPCYKCSICQKKVRACLLDNSMPAHLKELFHPEPYKDGLNSFQIQQFQEKHRERYMAYIDRTVSGIFLII